MQKIVKIMSSSKEVFIAEDGTEFDDKLKCTFYEYDTLKKNFSYNFKREVVKNNIHYKCETEEDFRACLIVLHKLYSSRINPYPTRRYWDDFDDFKDKWFYVDYDDTGDYPSFDLCFSLDRLGELKEAVQEYSELQNLFLSDM